MCTQPCNAEDGVFGEIWTTPLMNLSLWSGYYLFGIFYGFLKVESFKVNFLFLHYRDKIYGWEKEDLHCRMGSL